MPEEKRGGFLRNVGGRLAALGCTLLTLLALAALVYGLGCWLGR